MTCDLCKHSSLVEVYTVPSSRAGARVMLCENCGLLATAYHMPRTKGPRLSVSGGADFGNIRYGKGMRVARHLKLLDERIDWATIHSLLDLGSNRGAFIDAAYDRGDFSITAIEPDTAISPSYAGKPRVVFIGERTENVDLSHDSFDLIYSSHTFEHLDSLSTAFQQLNDCSKPGTLLLCEVPNVAYIAAPDIIAEWFIDKHTFHFSRPVLRQYLERFGWRILFENPSSEKDVITMLARFTGATHPAHADAATVSDMRVLVARYAATREANTEKMRSIAQAIESRFPKKIGVWGAGTTYDSIVSLGGLHPEKLAVIIDANLPKYVSHMHGVPLTFPEDAPLAGLDTLVIMSRDSEEEIAQEARKLGFSGELLSYRTLFAQV